MWLSAHDTGSLPLRVRSTQSAVSEEAVDGYSSCARVGIGRIQIGSDIVAPALSQSQFKSHNDHTLDAAIGAFKEAIRVHPEIFRKKFSSNFLSLEVVSGSLTAFSLHSLVPQ